MRGCFDTNVLVAAFVTRGLCADILQLVLAEHELVIGRVILKELEQTLRRKLKASDDRVQAALKAFTDLSLAPDPFDPSPVAIRDRSDGPALVSAIAGGAELLMTGDNDLLAIAAVSLLPILSPRSFWERMRRGA